MNKTDLEFVEFIQRTEIKYLMIEHVSFKVLYLLPTICALFIYRIDKDGKPLFHVDSGVTLGSHGAIFGSCLLNISSHAPKPASATASNITLIIA